MQTNNKQFYRIESNSFLLCRIAQHYLVVELGFGAARCTQSLTSYS